MSRLGAEHQPRTLRIAGKLDEPQRISRVDEANLAARARRTSVAQELERIEGELRAEMFRLRDVASRQAFRDIGNAVALVGKVRHKLAVV